MTSTIRFVIEPSSNSFVVKGYVGNDVVAEIPAKDRQEALVKAEKWKEGTRVLLSKTLKLLERETKGMSIERHGREEKVL